MVWEWDFVSGKSVSSQPQLLPFAGHGHSPQAPVLADPRLLLSELLLLGRTLAHLQSLLLPLPLGVVPQEPWVMWTHLLRP